MDAPTQHAVNAVAVAAPIASLWARAPEVVTVCAGVGAIIWYAIIITEKVLGWWAQLRQIRRSARTVAARLEKERRPANDPEAHS